MTAPALSWGLFGRGAHEARGLRVPEQPGPGRPGGDAPEPLVVATTGALPGAAAWADPVGVPPAPVGPDAEAEVPSVAGPAERALLEATRELGALHPLDRLERVAVPVPVLDAAPEPEPAPAEQPAALPPVLDVLPGAGPRRRSARDAVLPLVLLAELLTGVWLGSAKPWQSDAADPLQARFSSTAPVTGDLHLPETVAPAPLPLVPGAGLVLPAPAPSAATPTTSGPDGTRQPVDPFSPR